MTLTETALRIATAAHQDQVRKSDGSPYIIHPVMVAFILKEHGFREEVIAAGLCHDVLEDTQVTQDELVAALGEEIVQMIAGVSENKSLEWEERKMQYTNTVAAADEETKAVSIADKIHNAESISTDYADKGAAVWDAFNRGKEKKLWFEELLYAAVIKEWQHPLLARYRSALDVLKTLD